MSDYKPVYVDQEREKHRDEIAALKQRVAYLCRQLDAMTWNRDRHQIFAEKMERECANRDRGIRRLRRRLDRARREASGQAGWVQVERALPECDVDVLVYEEGWRTEVGKYLGDGVFNCFCTPTHWRPLPPGPEGA